MKCVYCERSSDEIPVILFEYKGQQHGVCSNHLPLLLHKPEMFEGKLPEVGQWGEPAEHHD